MAVVQLNQSMNICLPSREAVLIEKNVLTEVPEEIAKYIQKSPFYIGKVVYLDLQEKVKKVEEVITQGSSIYVEGAKAPVLVAPPTIIDTPIKKSTAESVKEVNEEVKAIVEKNADIDGLAQLMEITTKTTKKVTKSKSTKKG